MSPCIYQSWSSHYHLHVHYDQVYISLNERVVTCQAYNYFNVLREKESGYRQIEMSLALNHVLYSITRIIVGLCTLYLHAFITRFSMYYTCMGIHTYSIMVCNSDTTNICKYLVVHLHLLQGRSCITSTQ